MKVFFAELAADLGRRGLTVSLYLKQLYLEYVVSCFFRGHVSSLPFQLDMVISRYGCRYDKILL